MPHGAHSSVAPPPPAVGHRRAGRCSRARVRGRPPRGPVRRPGRHGSRPGPRGSPGGRRTGAAVPPRARRPCPGRAGRRAHADGVPGLAGRGQPRRSCRSRAIHASTSSERRGSPAERFRLPSSVTRMSSSMRTPMPRYSSGTVRSSGWKYRPGSTVRHHAGLQRAVHVGLGAGLRRSRARPCRACGRCRAASSGAGAPAPAPARPGPRAGPTPPAASASTRWAASWKSRYFGARPDRGDAGLLRLVHRVVDLALQVGEAAVDGQGAGDVGGVERGASPRPRPAAAGRRSAPGRRCAPSAAWWRAARRRRCVP